MNDVEHVLGIIAAVLVVLLGGPALCWKGWCLARDRRKRKKKKGKGSSPGA